MTDRYNTLTVVLERDIREDDAEALLSAIRMMRGVLTVEGNVADPGEYMAEERAKRHWQEKIAEVLWPNPGARKRATND